MRMGSMAMRLDGMKIGGLARRFAVQAAMSATIMTGLHVAASNGLSPADWLFGPADEADAAVPAAAPGRSPAEIAGPEGSAEIRFIAIPAARAFPDEDGPAPKQAAGTTTDAATTPAARTASSAKAPEEHVAGATPSARDAADSGYARAPSLPATVATPTPRPVLRAAVPRALPEPVEVAEMQAERLPFDLTPPADAPELARDAILEPPMPEDDGFGLHTLIPERRMLIRGVSAVGLHARDTLEGAALGAMALVGVR